MTDSVESQIQQVWATEQEILDVIHKVCTENGLRYSLAYGTLIGAVRHKGFIPWDDDIDLMMPREDYEKLLAIWDQAAPKGYILQNVRTDPDFTQSFTKIRKDHTTFLQFEFEREKQYHKGVFVDIFPGDRVAPGKLGRKTQYIACAVNLLYNRGHASGSGGMVGMVEKFLLKAPKEKYAKRREAAETWIRRWNGNDSALYVFPSTIECSRRYYPADLFENMRTIEFSSKTYQCVSDPDTVLRIDYGDYMQLPPVEERVWKHHPIVIDFEQNYEELSQSRG
ncbi:MAG: LicD family protein [Candidatus Limivicinus sp.]|nr:LicD family protein [Clostridiales bacterium]MDY6133832.1 LicD family protein [Candidatus Limivicinus sp.]